MVPLAVALNRGSWLTLAAGVAYGVLRWSWVRRDLRPLLVLLVAALVGAALAVQTGLLDSAVDQLATRSEDSNETRAGLYIETITTLQDSPLIGFGSTRPSVENPNGPPLGTHGQLWAVLFAHGFVGAACYVGFFVYALLRARSAHPVQHWAQVSLVIGLLQLPIYGHLPHQLLIMVGAAVMATWSGPLAPSRKPSRPQPTGSSR
jgi:O-antigen ligase